MLKAIVAWIVAKGVVLAFLIAPVVIAVTASQAFIAAQSLASQAYAPRLKYTGNWHRALFEPPKGWIEFEPFSERYRAVVMFRNGDRRPTQPLIYVRTHRGDADLGLVEYVGEAQRRWKVRVPTSEIERLADFKREGKPSFMVYLYRNPSVPDQAFEMTAFTKYSDPENRTETYFFQVVLASPTMEELEKAKPAFFETLERL